MAWYSSSVMSPFSFMELSAVSFCRTRLISLLPQRSFRRSRLPQLVQRQLLGSGDEIGGIVNVINGAFGLDPWADGCGSHRHERQRHLDRGFTALLSLSLPGSSLSVT